MRVCVRACVCDHLSSPSQLFQLVLKYVKKKKKRKRRREEGEETSEPVNIEASWKKFELPGKDEVTLLAADRTELDIMCAVVQENRTVVSYAVLQENLGRLEIPNPDGVSHRWKSLSICAVPKPTSFSASGEISLLNCPKKAYPSIYPKLPPQKDYDICCEDGQCSFCLRASLENTLNGSQTSLGEYSSSSLSTEEGRLEGEMVTGVSFSSLGEREPGSPITKRGKLQVTAALSDEEKETSFSTGRKRRRRYFSAFNTHYTKRSKLFTAHQPPIADIPFQLAPSLHDDRVQSLLQHQVMVLCHFEFYQRM